MSNQNPTKNCIHILGAKTKNLKNIQVSIPYNKLIAITGLSGSGKTALGFDTLFAEGSLRYIKSFNTHARQFLEKISHPPVKSIQGILPSIGLRRKGSIENPHNRLGTSTDIYSYIKLLYTHLGTTISPISGNPVKQDTVQDVIDHIQQIPANNKVIIAAQLNIPPERTFQEAISIELSKGFTRILHQDKIAYIEDLLQEKSLQPQAPTYIVVDTIPVEKSGQLPISRISESVKTAFFEGQGTSLIHVPGKHTKVFSDRFEADGITFEKPSTHFFSFNNIHGACKKCTGTGQYWGIDPDKVIPNPQLSIQEGAILPWNNILFDKEKKNFLQKTTLPLHRPYKNFTQQEKQLLWYGDEQNTGIYSFFEQLIANHSKIQNRIIHAHYQGIIPCKTCQETGLRPEVGYVKINNKSIIDLLNMSIDTLHTFFQKIKIPQHQKKIANVLLEEINNRLSYLKKVGLGYMNLIRKMHTLSGGEYERAKLAKVLGSPLINTLYVLDRPTSGLHQHNAKTLIQTLIDLKNAGNTVVVIGNEEQVIRAADIIIDMGPEAGTQGGEVVFQGSPHQTPNAQNSYTADYLSGKRNIPIPEKRNQATHHITLQKIYKNNLQNISITFPLGILTVVTGISGSGKSTLIQDVLHPVLSHHLGIQTLNHRNKPEILGDTQHIHHIVYMGQKKLNKSKKSYLATYLKTYQYIRELLAQQPLAKQRAYTIGHFSLNTPGGRCEKCLGHGMINIDMQFMEDILLTCEACNGKRFQTEILEITYQGKNIIDILNMTVTEALIFFKEHPSICNKIKPLQQLGVHSLKLGQPSSTFSNGEAQKVKIARYLNTENKMEPTFFIFDEPLTGLHFHDIAKLITALKQLTKEGHTVLVIEHNMEIIKSADWIIDLGPGSGAKGGKIIFEGTPENMIKLSNNNTAHHLKKKMILSAQVT